MSAGPVVAIAVRGRGAIEVVRKAMGKTNSAEAEPGTIRGDWGMSRSFNMIHGSDSPANATKELALWFAPGEVVDYPLGSSTWVYDPSDDR
jgi:nucleoside-diphosphate kinase